MRYRAGFILTVALCAFLIPTLGAFSAETENGITIEVGRVFHGVLKGVKYYGYSGGKITLPTDAGGLFSFDLWNDIPLAGTVVTNTFMTDIGGERIVIRNYATSKQIIEPYAEDQSWGAGGTLRVTLAIPPGVKSFEYRTEGSETGVEISGLSFTPGYRSLPGGYSIARLREIGPAIVQTSRIFTGMSTKRAFYGWTGGTIHLPVTSGGFLSFRVWNDQPKGHNTVTNRVLITIGGRKESFVQYTTSMDLEEVYLEDQGWGPAGGAEVSMQIPEGIDRVVWSTEGSVTGMELSDVVFSTGSPISISVKEKVRTLGTVLIEFQRRFTGATTGRIYHGWDRGTVILPNLKGGKLSFSVWNDHPTGKENLTNRFAVKVGTQELRFEIVSTLESRKELYREDGGWGPGGKTDLTIVVPPGIGIVEIYRVEGCESGIAVGDCVFASDWR